MNEIYFAQLQTFSLGGVGVSVGDTYMLLQSFNQINGTPLTMSNFGIIGYGTCQPAEGTQEEQISWSGVVQNADGTATLTGIETVLEIYPYTATSGFGQNHGWGTNFVVSNTGAFYNTFANKQNPGTIIAEWTFNALANGANPKIDSNSYEFTDLDYITLGAVYTILEGYLKTDGSNEMLANLNMDSHRIINVTNPTAAQDAATKIYVDNSIAAGGVPAAMGTPGLVNIATQAQFDATTDTEIIGGLTYYNMAPISMIKSGVSAPFMAGVNFTGGTNPQVIVWGDGSNALISSVTPNTTAVLNGVATSEVAYGVRLDAVQVNTLISGISCGFNTVGSPSDQLNVAIQSESGGVPSGTVLGSKTFSPTGSIQHVTFNTPIEIDGGSNYWVVFSRTGSGDNVNYYQIQCVNNGSGDASLQVYNGSSWAISNIIPGGGVYVQYTSGSVFPATSATNLFTYAISTTYAVPAFQKLVRGFVNTTISSGSSIRVYAEGFLTGFTGLTVASEYYLQGNSTIGTSGSLKAGSAVSTTELLINRSS